MKPTSALSTIIAAVLASPFALGADAYRAPRTEWGQPDLQGVWNFSSDVPMERPAQFGDRQFLNAEEVTALRARRAARDEGSDAALAISGVDESYNDFWIENAGISDVIRTSHIVEPADGRIPALVPGAIASHGVYGGETTGESRPVRRGAGGIGTDGPEDRGLSERCIIGFNAGPPFSPSLYNNNVQIFQNKDHVVLLTEMIHDARIVPIYDSPADFPPLEHHPRSWTGDSQGYWDGDTLVVVTRNFNGLSTSFGNAGTSWDKVLTERFTRVDAITVDYAFTIDDPATYTDRFTGIVPMTKVAGLLYEYACHEGNYAMVNILRGARTQEGLADARP